MAASTGEIRVGDDLIERVEEFKYLDSCIGSVDKDIDVRCKAASRQFGRLLPLWQAPLQLLRSRFLKHYGHALRTSQREKSAGVKLSPQSMVVEWLGEHGSSYCTRVLELRNGDVESL